eukprot:jgi/Mesvir1/24912/Mv16900-RA.1
MTLMTEATVYKVNSCRMAAEGKGVSLTPLDDKNSFRSYEGGLRCLLRAWPSFCATITRPMQAKLLVWADLSRQQVEHLLRLSAKASDVPMLRKTVDEYMGLDDVQSNHEQAALEDLYFNTIQYPSQECISSCCTVDVCMVRLRSRSLTLLPLGAPVGRLQHPFDACPWSGGGGTGSTFAWKLGFTPEKVSAFFSIMKRTHFDAVGGRLTLRKSFAAFQDLLLAHAVQRPPYSVGIFSLHDVQVLTDYAINSYFRHYKLYQYAFTSRFTLSLATIPAVVLQFPPRCARYRPPSLRRSGRGRGTRARRSASDSPPPQLAGFACLWAPPPTWPRVYVIVQAVAQKRQDEELLAQAEVAREAAIRAAYDGSVPEEMEQQVQASVAEKLGAMKESMEASFQRKEAELLDKVAQLESKAAGALT